MEPTIYIWYGATLSPTAWEANAPDQAGEAYEIGYKVSETQRAAEEDEPYEWKLPCGEPVFVYRPGDQDVHGVGIRLFGRDWDYDPWTLEEMVASVQTLDVVAKVQMDTLMDELGIPASVRQVFVCTDLR